MSNYKRSKTTVSLINYHFVFCPRYRRKIFLISGVEDRFKCLAKEICESIDIDIIAIECDKDHAHMLLSCPPSLSPSDVMKHIKGRTSKALREEFVKLSKMPSLWTRSFFVSTVGEVDFDTVKEYIDNQKKFYA